MCLSFHLEDEEQLVHGYIGELLGYKKEARSKLMYRKNVRRIFGGMISREDYKEPKISPCQNFFGIKYLKQGKWR
jgi:hypothetical protein